LAFGILGLTGFPIVGSVIAIIIGRHGVYPDDDDGAEKMRKVGRALGFLGVTIATVAFGVGIVRVLT
jgi:hypothetical protein